MTVTRESFIDEFGIYNRIQDTLMFLGNNENMVCISSILSYYIKNKKKEKYDYFYSEVQYFSENMNCETKKIRRNYDCYLMMENVRPIGTYRETIILRGKDLELLYTTLLPKFEFIISNFDKIYQGVDNKMRVTDFIKPFMIEIGIKSLIFQPGINKTFTEELKPSIEMYLNGNKDNKICMSFDQVYGFMYLIRRFNLYSYAASMLNFIGRPPMGTNLIDMVDRQNYNQVEATQFIESGKHRLIGESDKDRENYFKRKNLKN